MNPREQLVEDARAAFTEAWEAKDAELRDHGQLGDGTAHQRSRAGIEAALAVFEGAGSFLPVASDVKGTAHTDDEREALESLRDELFPCVEPFEKRNPPMRGDDAAVDRRDDERYSVDIFIDALLDGRATGFHRTVQGEPSDTRVVDIANRAQEETGRSIWPSTVRAVLRAAAETGGEHRG